MSRRRFACSVALLSLIWAVSAKSQQDNSREIAERRVQAALDRLVGGLDSNPTSAFAPGLACPAISAEIEGEALQPCSSETEDVRLQQLRKIFGGAPAYVIDWLKLDSGPRGNRYEIQIKVRSEPPRLPVLRFVDARGVLLLDAVDGIGVAEAAIDDTRDARQRVEGRLQTLFRLGAPAAAAEAALHMACVEPGRDEPRRCDYRHAEDRMQVDAVRKRIREFLSRVGATGWGLTGYSRSSDVGGGRHRVEIGYLTDGGASDRATATAVFIDADGSLLLADLEDWPQ